jgi:hypothetical protein
MRENTRGYRRKTVNLHVELVSDVMHLKRPLLQNMHGKEEQKENSQEEEVQMMV